MKENKHFIDRCVQRGVNLTDPQTLYNDIKIALGDPEKYMDYVEIFKNLNNGSIIWRIRTKLEDKFFYVLTKNGDIVTIFDKKIADQYKEMAKRRRRFPERFL